MYTCLHCILAGPWIAYDTRECREQYMQTDSMSTLFTKLDCFNSSSGKCINLFPVIMSVTVCPFHNAGATNQHLQWSYRGEGRDDCWHMDGFVYFIFLEGGLLPMMYQIRFTLKMENMNVSVLHCQLSLPKLTLTPWDLCFDDLAHVQQSGDCALYSFLIVLILFTYHSDTTLHFEALLVSGQPNTIKVSRISLVTPDG